eukprot:3839437-Prorocentrum_lima.AAC.1
MSRGLACLDQGEAETGGPPASPRCSASNAVGWANPRAALGGAPMSGAEHENKKAKASRR